MKKIIDLVSSRIFVFVLAVLLQLVWLVALAWGMRNISTTVGWIMDILSLFLVLWLVNKKINPSYKLAWTILILVIPVFGAIVYLLFGESRVAKKMTRESEAVLNEIGNYFKEDPRTRTEQNFRIWTGEYPSSLPTSVITPVFPSIRIPPQSIIR